MKYIYGVKKSGLSLVTYLNSINEEFFCWDDDSITREKFKQVWNHASKLSASERFKPSNYSEISYNSAYEVTLMYEFLKK